MRVMIYLNIIKRTPAATADPITPAIFGPIACISKKFLGFSDCNKRSKISTCSYRQKY